MALWLWMVVCLSVIALWQTGDLCMVYPASQHMITGIGHPMWNSAKSNVRHYPLWRRSNTRKRSLDTPVHTLEWKLCVRTRHRLTQREILLFLYQRTSVIKGGGEAHTLIISPWVIYRQIRMWTCRTALHAWTTLNKSVSIINMTDLHLRDNFLILSSGIPTHHFCQHTIKLC